MADSSLSKTYQKKTDKQHILDNPDTYIGSIEQLDTHQYIYNDPDPDAGTNDKPIVYKEINIIPGLYKLFDEGIVNCRDHCIRMEQAIKDGKENTRPVTSIDVTINPEDGTISMFNDGNGIDVAEHPEYKVWIPELIFGHLRTSTNYNKEEKKIVGGKNGFGFKLVLIWSTWGRIETVDHIRGLKYVQEFGDNLDKVGKPSITKCKSKPYTKVSFKPDYARLKLPGLTPDMVALLKRRVWDIAGVTNKSIRVKYNEQIIPTKNFQQYVDLYIGSKSDTARIHEEANDRWEYAICLAPDDEFTQVSFVNGIFTNKGGKHIEYILNQIIRKLTAYIKAKKHIDVKPTTIKEQLMLFVRCDIENPSFDSQTKDFMNTPIGNFGSTCTVSDKFIEKLAKMGVMAAACSLTEVKDNKAAKKNDGTKTRSIRNIPKLVDANYAGTEKSAQCTIIFCEGDSAKAGIISGLSKDDRNTIGVYPMKGKLFNVRGEAALRISENKEIAEIKQIMGLETGQKYTEESVKRKLRYGRILFMTDQDLDGSHIKGLGLNLFDSEWSTLIKLPNFIGFMNTPILKARKGNQELLFYNEGEYEQWKQDNSTAGWNVKYYKGLGTSTAREFKEYFANKKMVFFDHSGGTCTNSIDMVFNKKRSDDRKTWLAKYDRELYLDTNKESVSYTRFIDQELIHFSKYDCDRSIPNLMDGLKISQRKILFAGFKKRLNAEIKVAQFSGYVSEHSGYHHGEASLNGAIVNMAQNFVGSNNINLFEPRGQFGTRLRGGKDSASERYIFTQLNKITRCIYPEADDKILRYLDDDGTPVEPVYYVPIIPMILVNGTKGIGTGFSTDIMQYNPLQIIMKTRAMLTSDISNAPLEIESYYEGFKGTIQKINESKYLIKGVYTKLSQTIIQVTELPVGFWTEDFKEHLETLIENKQSASKKSNKAGEKPPAQVRDYSDMSTDTMVDFRITFATGAIQNLLEISEEHGCNGLEKLLKLYTTQSTTNMHLFDGSEHLKKYNKLEEIIQDYYGVRLGFYQKRKDYLIDEYEKDLVLLSNRARFIQETLDDKIDMRKKTKSQIQILLSEHKYAKIEGDEEYKYLVKMPMDSVTKENVDKLLKEKDDKELELKTLKEKTIQKMWLDELETLQCEYLKYRQLRENIQESKDESGKEDKKKSEKSAKTKKLVIKKP